MSTLKALYHSRLAILRETTAQEWKKKFIRDTLWLIVMNFVWGLIVTFVMRIGGNVLENFAVSFLIGIYYYIFGYGGKFLIWGKQKPTYLKFYLWVLCCVPFALPSGLVTAAFLFNWPLSGVISFQIRYASTTLTITLAAALFSAWHYWNRNKISELQAHAEAEKARTASMEKQAMQAQLQLLQAQIEPHMLFNTLANLQGLIALDAPRAQYMLEQLIQYLRASLSSSRSENTTLKQEFSLMRSYLELLAIRMGKRLSYTLDLPQELQNTTIAPMLLQPLVENAIKHGVEPKIEGGSVHVSASTDQHFLHLKVIDTGLGLPFDYADRVINAPNDSDHHVGNANIRDRLLAIYNANASLTLSPNQPEGVIAHLRIPLQIQPITAETQSNAEKTFNNINPAPSAVLR